MAAVRLVVCGALGRMGSRVCALSLADPRFRLVAGVEAQAQEHPAGFPVWAERELASRLGDADVLVEFSTAQASVRFAEHAAKGKLGLVSGTTGRTPAQEEALRVASRRAPIFAAANFSPGMNVLLHLAKAAARALPSWDAGIVDVHHKAKRDAPSGSALRLAEAAGSGSRSKPQVVSLREGDVVGDHTLLLAGPEERLELVHRAQSRDVFARGALEAAAWLKGRKPGLYGMEDLLRLG